MTADEQIASEQMESILNETDRVLITGASGFLGCRVVEAFLSRGFSKLRCFVRPTSNLAPLRRVLDAHPAVGVEITQGNLLSPTDCAAAVQGAVAIVHVAAAAEKTFPGCFMNSVVTTRNLLEAATREERLKRFVNVSSLVVYSNARLRRRDEIDETCQLEAQFMRRFDAYCFGKTKQDEIVMEYGASRRLPYVIIRPGPLYGPGARAAIHSRVGIDTFGFFMHVGGSNRLPLTYVDNCAEALVAASVTPGIEGEVFNVVDDNPPTSRQFLRAYKRNVRRFRSLYVPYGVFYVFAAAWERYARWSRNQLPPAFNPLKCSAEWKGNRYSTKKIKARTGWTPSVPAAEGMKRHFSYLRGVDA